MQKKKNQKTKNKKHTSNCFIELPVETLERLRKNSKELREMKEKERKEKELLSYNSPPLYVPWDKEDFSATEETILSKIQNFRATFERQEDYKEKQKVFQFLLNIPPFEEEENRSTKIDFQSISHHLFN